ncbi:MAG: hypothetical protein BM557_03415 [Flavobacterium sp. MedPE-SWcel]|uniref:thioredoxin family protein n=1 Tax=uncultured Flavobacterium sp. TaxID=165435 RepID=UPI000922E526|nr:thioredoxin family protein [uncultured Flavobacterium sp.]OIQ21313.1 MAG: hypothetical protein BM557_03415 [Flavobacterium sp. MedPE-SWcel]
MKLKARPTFKNTFVLQLMLCLAFVLFITKGYSQKSYTTSFADLPEKIAQNPKPILIKLHTDWCAVCKIQDKKIEKDSKLQALLAKLCYYIELDAETTDSITFNGKVYSYTKQGNGKGYNQLSEYLTNGSNSYPYWVILSSDYTIIDTYGGLLKNDQLKALLTELSKLN